MADKKLIIYSILFAILSTIMFIVLMPGVIVTLPGNSAWITFFSREVNFFAVIVHTMIYIVGLLLLMVFNYFIVDPMVVRLLK